MEKKITITINRAADSYGLLDDVVVDTVGETSRYDLLEGVIALIKIISDDCGRTPHQVAWMALKILERAEESTEADNEGV